MLEELCFGCPFVEFDEASSFCINAHDLESELSLYPCPQAVHIPLLHSLQCSMAVQGVTIMLIVLFKYPSGYCVLITNETFFI